MNVLGMDLATRSGFAVLDGERLVHAESFRPHGTEDAEIFDGFRRRLMVIIAQHDIRHAALEEPLRSDLKRREADGTEKAFSTMRTYLRLYGLRAHAIQICHELGVDCREVNQSTWRKAFVGNGRADKADSLRQCALLRWLVPDNNAAEAAGVAWWLNGEMGRHHSPANQRTLPLTA